MKPRGPCEWQKAVLGQLLKVKVLEEAFELFWEADPNKSFEEMADILEVIQSACSTHGRSFQDLVELAEKKRNERGGFDRGIVLIVTARPRSPNWGYHGRDVASA